MINRFARQLPKQLRIEEKIYKKHVRFFADRLTQEKRIVSNFLTTVDAELNINEDKVCKKVR